MSATADGIRHLRLLICGGRDYADRAHLFATLDRVHAKYFGLAGIIAGAARGADNLAAEWAKDRGVPLTEFPADWTKHGKRAGPIRNQQMLDEGRPDAVVAFPGGRGTADMVRRGRKAGLVVWEVPPPSLTPSLPPNKKEPPEFPPAAHPVHAIVTAPCSCIVPDDGAACSALSRGSPLR